MSIKCSEQPKQYHIRLFLEKKKKKEKLNKNPFIQPKGTLGSQNWTDFINMSSLLSASYVVYKLCLKQGSQSIGLV